MIREVQRGHAGDERRRHRGAADRVRATGDPVAGDFRRQRFECHRLRLQIVAQLVERGLHLALGLGTRSGEPQVVGQGQEPLLSSVVQIPSTTVNDSYAWASPTLANGRVYVGISSACDAPFVRGAVKAYDQQTGVLADGGKTTSTNIFTHVDNDSFTWQAIDRTVDGFHARVVQHECDHLIGKLYPMRVRDFTQFGYTEVLFPGIAADEDD